MVSTGGAVILADSSNSFTVASMAVVTSSALHVVVHV